MKLHELEYTEGARRASFRVGRGIGTGNGKTSGKGQKGQNSRSGGGTRLGFEGGQNPLFRRLPKRGFHNSTRIEFAIVNVEDLEVFEDGVEVTPTLLKEAGLVRKEYDGVKILGNGTLTKKLTVKANKFSKAAEAAIKNAGGTIEVI
ncbi:50S ribosomal protein L15 [Coprobacillus sp. CAG:826]|jgi:large subunit ribosomal protein L15|nr:50S ribosomal protein L15 [Coprobacillus sp. CAG:826]